MKCVHLKEAWSTTMHCVRLFTSGLNDYSNISEPNFQQMNALYSFLYLPFVFFVFLTSLVTVQIISGVFMVLGVGWELPPKFPRIFYLGENSPCPILF